ncbi:hypothetical protein FQN54_004947 [Arachnomyces sp. PD_36]|nr:hypothetical protein FQN54_004947 [Arachnomyces sp. PD_36]
MSRTDPQSGYHGNEEERSEVEGNGDSSPMSEYFREGSGSEKEVEGRTSTQSKDEYHNGSEIGRHISRSEHGPSGLYPSPRDPTCPSEPALSRRGSTSTHGTEVGGIAQLPTASRVSTDPHGNTYPEGGLEAYLVVLGCFLALFGTLGMLNSVGTFQAYLINNQLKGYSDGSIGWIFSVYVFLTFFGGIQFGPITDAKGPRFLVLAGSTIAVVDHILVGFCTKYWHFMIVLGLLNGIATSLIFTPAISSVGHFFLRLRGHATGLATTGGSLGGVVIPLMLQALFPKIGFAWATRALALVCFCSLAVACLLVRNRLPPKPATRENMLPDFRMFLDPVFTLATIGIFFCDLGIFLPITYISSYGIDNGVSHAFSYQLLALLNVGSIFGRWLPGIAADYIGRFNTMIITVFLCVASTAALWLPAGGTVAMLVVYVLLFGFASGSNIGLAPVCIGQLCATENYGRYYASAYTFVSFGTLIGIPIAGQIKTASGGDYWGLITFTALLYVAALFSFIAAKILKLGWKPFAVF